MDRRKAITQERLEEIIKVLKEGGNWERCGADSHSIDVNKKGS